VPAAPKVRPDRRLYQPPLPWAGDPCPKSAAPERPPWRLDENTRRAGRQGVAAARAALAGATRPENDRQADAA
jgi:hypothetical protein